MEVGIIIIKEFDIFKKIITYSSVIADECIILFNKNGIFLTPATRGGTILVNCSLKSNMFDDLPEEDVLIAINMVKLSDILKSFKGKDIEMDISENNIVIKNKGKEFTIKALYDEYLPQQRVIPPEFYEVDKFCIDTSFIVESVSDISKFTESLFIGLKDNVFFIQQRGSDDMDYINKKEVGEYNDFKKIFAVNVMNNVLKFIKLNDNVDVIQIEENPFLLKMEDDNMRLIIAIAHMVET